MQVDYDDFCRVTGCGSQSLSVLVMDSNPKRSKSDTVTYSNLLLLFYIYFSISLRELKETFIGCEIEKPNFFGQWGPSPREKEEKLPHLVDLKVMFEVAAY